MTRDAHGAAPTRPTRSDGAEGDATSSVSDRSRVEAIVEAVEALADAVVCGSVDDITDATATTSMRLDASPHLPPEALDEELRNRYLAARQRAAVAIGSHLHQVERTSRDREHDPSSTGGRR